MSDGGFSRRSLLPAHGGGRLLPLFLASKVDLYARVKGDVTIGLL